jgi:hypothetical protein
VLASSSPAEGEVVYTPANQVVGRGQKYAIDLNHDGITDYTLDNYFSQGGRHGSYITANLIAVPAAGNIVCSSQGIAAAALQKGAAIGPKDGFEKACSVMADRMVEGSFGTYSFGRWFNVSNLYLGLRFEIEGQVHYGWARLSVKWNHAYWIVATLSGYAYETEANTPIKAGNEGTGEAGVNEVTPLGDDRSLQPKTSPSLAALSLGAPGLEVWRRD